MCKDSANRGQNKTNSFVFYAEVPPFLWKVCCIFRYVAEFIRVSIGGLYGADNFAATF